jgi:hypothetical protein
MLPPLGLLLLVMPSKPLLARLQLLLLLAVASAALLLLLLLPWARS